MSSSWYEILIEVTSDTKELISERLFEIGAEGVNENVNKPNLLQVFFRADVKDSALLALKKEWNLWKEKFQNLPDFKVVPTQVRDENWSEAYKKYYVAQPLTDLFFLRPKWDTKTLIPNGMIPIVMDPGQAFGTGLHPSTKMCIKTIQSHILENINKDCLKCLDVGTGTGILALAAYHLGVKQVEGIDNDPVAVQVAQENMEINCVKGIDLSSKDIRELTPTYDFIISNILLETHRELSAEYSRLISLGGLLLLSGLLGHQKRELFDFILPLGFVNLESKNYQEWASFLFIKREEK